MKKLITICLVITLVAVTVQARINTIASSTMIFQGNLTSQGGGVYTGTVAMIDEDALDKGDGESGFDIYAKNGAWATYYGSTTYLEGQVTDHDAYTTTGGWGTTYDPDCGDWYNYQLTLTSNSWAVEYNGNVGHGNPAGATCAPMSGSIDWLTNLAAETGTGAYYPSTGTSKNLGYAATFASNHGQSTAGAWDMDWSWGSDYVPLCSSFFDVFVELDVNGELDRVTLTPVPEPMTMSLLALGGLLLRRKK